MKYVHTNIVYSCITAVIIALNKSYSPRRMLEAGGVTNELIGLEGVTGMVGLVAEDPDRSVRSVSLPRLLEGRLSF